jgi:hypothetical protein
MIASSIPLLKRFVGGLHESQADAMPNVIKLLQQLNISFDENAKKQRMFKNSRILDILT